MTVKEKAEELVNKFIDLEYPHPTWSNNKETCSYSYEMAKECALICVDEIIKEHCHESEHKNPIAQDRWVSFWMQVKQEIEKL